MVLTFMEENNLLDGILIKEYPSAKEAGRILGIGQSNISNCCNNKPSYKTVSGFIFKYKIMTYTEEDMRNAIEMAQEQVAVKYTDNEYSFKYSQAEILQSLNKPKEIESVDIEMADYQDFSEGKFSLGIIQKPKLDKEGLLIITKINYK